MAKPYDLFCRFLVTKGASSVEEVNEQLKELGILPVTETEFDAQYDSVHNHVPGPVITQIEEQRLEGDFFKWMTLLELKELWSYEPKYRTDQTRWIKLAYDIHYDPQLRVALNALLIKGCKPTDIIQGVNIKFSSMLQERHIEVYRRFFWDPARMSRAAWRDYLGKAAEYERAVLFCALTEPLESVKALLELPAKTNVSDALQYLLTKSVQKAKEYLRVNSKEANVEAREWIDKVVLLTDKYEKYRSGNAADFGKELQMKFEYIETDFPSPDEDALREAKVRAGKASDAQQSKESAEKREKGAGG